jgi:hypothetical protein
MAKPEGILLHWRDSDGRLSRTSARYGRSEFLRAKVHYLAPLLAPGRPLWIWGAGRLGRQLHDRLQAHGIRIAGFIDIHPRRRSKRGLPVIAPEQLPAHPDRHILAAVPAWGARAEIGAFLRQRGYREQHDFRFLA